VPVVVASVAIVLLGWRHSKDLQVVVGGRWKTAAVACCAHLWDGEC